MPVMCVNEEKNKYRSKRSTFHTFIKRLFYKTSTYRCKKSGVCVKYNYKKSVIHRWIKALATNLNFLQTGLNTYPGVCHNFGFIKSSFKIFKQWNISPKGAHGFEKLTSF